jgi:hypothetical protein
LTPEEAFHVRAEISNFVKNSLLTPAFCEDGQWDHFAWTCKFKPQITTTIGTNRNDAAHKYDLHSLKELKREYVTLTHSLPNITLPAARATVHNITQQSYQQPEQQFPHIMKPRYQLPAQQATHQNTRLQNYLKNSINVVFLLAVIGSMSVSA